MEPASISYVPNIMEENKLFEKIGVGIGEDEAYKVYKSLAVCCLLFSYYLLKRVQTI